MGVTSEIVNKYNVTENTADFIVYMFGEDTAISRLELLQQQLQRIPTEKDILNYIQTELIKKKSANQPVEDQEEVENKNSLPDTNLTLEQREIIKKAEELSEKTIEERNKLLLSRVATGILTVLIVTVSIVISGVLLHLNEKYIMMFMVLTVLFYLFWEITSITKEAKSDGAIKGGRSKSRG